MKRKSGSERRTPSDTEYIHALDRGLAVLRVFTHETPRLTMSEVAEATGLTRAVARRYLFTLRRLGYLVETDARYRLTPKILDLGFSYLASLGLGEASRPFMTHVVETLRESCSLGVLDGTDVVYVARVVADRIMTTNIVVGTRLPAHATAMGKVLLAYLTKDQLDDYFSRGPLRPMTTQTILEPATLRAALAEVRSRGYSTNDQESEKGVRTVAVPVFDQVGDVVAAMNLAGHAARVSMPELRNDHLPVLVKAAQGLSRALGFRGAYPTRVGEAGAVVRS